MQLPEAFRQVGSRLRFRTADAKDGPSSSGWWTSAIHAPHPRRSNAQYLWITPE